MTKWLLHCSDAPCDHSKEFISNMQMYHTSGILMWKLCEIEDKSIHMSCHVICHSDLVIVEMKPCNVLMYIHTLQLDFLFYDMLFSKYATRSVLKISTTLRLLRPDCARCFWYSIAHIIITSTDQKNINNFIMFSGILKPFNL